MALTEAQRQVCRLIAANRMEQGESYIAGGAALNAVTGGARVSRDIDLFHDSAEALQATWEADRRLLGSNGYDVQVVQERPAFVEAIVVKGPDKVLMEWAQDSAYRFFPLVRHEDLGLTLHPFDLATNKTLALVGRLEPRDWVDLIHCHQRIQRLGYLFWAACGKDIGFSPAMILQEARRTTHYSVADVAQLAFEGESPDAAALARQWRTALGEADEIAKALPPEKAGQCVLDREAKLLMEGPKNLVHLLRKGAVRFHAGSIRGALPQVIG